MKKKYPKRINIPKVVENIAAKAKYYSGFDNTGKAYFDQFCKHIAKFIANNYRRRRK